MRRTWRREDYVYGAAALVAAVLVGYLVAGNFGLVPTPGHTQIPEGAVTPSVASAVGGGPAGGVLDGGALIPAVAPALPGPGASRPRTTAVTPDTTTPEANITTPSGAVLSLLEAAKVEGVANDPVSGVEEVVVNFFSSNGVHTVTADVTCADEGRHECTWSAKVPSALASYEVVAYAIDTWGNVGASAPVAVTVVNTGVVVEGVVGVVERVPGVLGDLVGAVPQLLEDTVRGVLGLLGR